MVLPDTLLKVQSTRGVKHSECQNRCNGNTGKMRFIFKELRVLNRRVADNGDQKQSDKKLYTAARQELSPLLHRDLRILVKNFSPVKKPACSKTTLDNA